MTNRKTNKSHKKRHLKGASLTNAIFICVIISIFSGCLVLISHYQNILNATLYMQEDLLSKNENAFIYFINNSESIPYNKVQEQDIFEDGILSYFEKRNWGFYDILICETIFKNDTISKIALVGQKNKTQNAIALYVTDYDKPLKLSGKTKILGDIKIPNGKTDYAYINGQRGNSIKLIGRQLKSNDKLPKTEKEISLDVSNLPNLDINSFNEEPVFINRFDNPTKVINLDRTPALKNITCKGNLVLFSNNELEIGPSITLNDVIVMAPTVKIKSGFKGNIQIIAKQEVIVEENVSLMYPSSIYIKNDSHPVSVQINEHSMLVGGIVIDGNTYNNSSERKLTP